MAIQQTKKHSDLEKRLKILRAQVYGKSSYQLSDKKQNRSEDQPAARGERLTTESFFISDITYLYKDLSKIVILSGFAIGIQLILFFLSRNHPVNINLF